MAIPAIAPPDKPLLWLALEAAVDTEDVGVAVVIDVLVANVMEAVIVGRTTLAHLSSALEL
jgi:hypothetical protein